nr:ribonuclease H-like domain-containing protein [Tanacetum cinerariifolium]
MTLKRSKCENKGIVQTEMELELEQTQKGYSHEVSISTEGVKELKRNVRIKGVKREALHTLRAKTRIVDGVVQIVAPTNVEQRLAKKNKLKARGTFLMALLDKHQLKFNIHKDAKSLMEAIERDLESVTAAPSIFVASSKTIVSTLSNVDSLSDAVIYSFFASQSNSPQLDNKDLKQIDPDDLEEMDLKWQMALLTMRARRFLKRTGRNLGANGTYTIGFDMSKVKCYNCHRRGHFPGNADYQGITGTKKLLEELSQQWYLLQILWCLSVMQLVAMIRVFKLKKTLLIMHLWHTPHQAHQVLQDQIIRKSQLDVLSYKTGLELVEARLVVYQKNETVFKEDIKLLKLDVMLRDNAMSELRKKFKKDEKERNDLKLTLDKFQTSSKNLSKLLESQVSNKTGLVFDSQVFNCQVSECEELHNQESDNRVTCEGYHAIPPPYTRTFMPPKPNLVFTDDPTASESVANMFNVESSTHKPRKDMSKTYRPDAPIVEDL